jgi:N-carbamoyl-L-amino-acid hydrolase
MTLGGQPNHGGTTPMKYRKDAGLLAARINVHAFEVTQKIPGQLANMGVIRVEPGNVNVVPERVTVTLDLRNPSDERLAEAEAAIRDFATKTATAAGLSIDIRDIARFPSQPFAEPIIAKVEAAAKTLGLPVRRMISGAGHDAQMMALLCPTAMVFVPSIGGLSHNPKEFTEDADLIAGVNVLLQVALDIANA